VIRSHPSRPTRGEPHYGRGPVSVCHHQCWLVISDDVCPSISAVSSTPAGSIDHGGDGATEPVRTTDSFVEGVPRRLAGCGRSSTCVRMGREGVFPPMMPVVRKDLTAVIELQGLLSPPLLYRCGFPLGLEAVA
jgi:hypothetical protein